MTAQLEWQLLESHFRTTVESAAGEYDEPRPSDQALEFALGRLEEGRQIAEFLHPRFPSPPVRVLDLGAGNGGVASGLANDPHYRVTALDLVLHEGFRSLRRATSLPVHQVVGIGGMLPFADRSFDVVLCLETIEHVDHPRTLGREIMRVLRPGGCCMLTTPARLRHLLAPDPHYGIRGLLILPDPLQRWAAEKIVERYDVTHIFWHVRGITRCFPERGEVETLVNIPYPGIPRTPFEILWYLFRAVLWDRIIVHRKGSGDR